VKTAAIYATHLVIAMIASTFVGSMLVLALGYRLAKPLGPLVSSPFTPLLWGVGLAAGILLTRASHSTSGRWVWVCGLLWLAFLVSRDLRGYDPRWCQGCTKLQFIWYNYFTSRNCMQECFGEFLGTVPMLNSLAYSIGAAVWLRFNQHRVRASPEAPPVVKSGA
jgi:hypothetical protein